MTGDSDDQKTPPHFDLEMYKKAKEQHAHNIIALIQIAAAKARAAAKAKAKAAAKASEDSDEIEEEVTPQKTNAGQQFGCKGCQTKD